MAGARAVGKGAGGLHRWGRRGGSFSVPPVASQGGLIGAGVRGVDLK